jgi:hypothetical protein
MNTAFALGQVMFGLLVAWQARRYGPVAGYMAEPHCGSLLAAIRLHFYRVVVFSMLIMAAAITGQKGSHL